MLVELLQPATPELARRWLAALLLVPAEERESVVRAVEAKITSMYGGGQRPQGGDAGSRSFDVVHPPAQRDGFVEQVITTYEQTKQPDGSARPARVVKAPRRGRGAS